jgi:predicted Fe-Mo cluster-binding NifX family protein
VCERARNSILYITKKMDTSDVRLLHDACAEGDEHVEMAIDRGVDLNIADNHGQTPLHVACDKGHGSIVTMLIDGGADLNVAKRDGQTPLHRACFFGHESVVRVLIDGGADLNITDGRGWTPLHVCSVVAYTTRIDEALLDILRVLILNGADTQARDSQGRLPVELLRAEDRQSIEIYEEAVEEVDSRALRPVLK